MSEAREAILERVRRALEDVPAAESAADVPVERGYRHEDRPRERRSSPASWSAWPTTARRCGAWVAASCPRPWAGRAAPGAPGGSSCPDLPREWRAEGGWGGPRPLGGRPRPGRGRAHRVRAGHRGDRHHRARRRARQGRRGHPAARLPPLRRGGGPGRGLGARGDRPARGSRPGEGRPLTFVSGPRPRPTSSSTASRASTGPASSRSWSCAVTEARAAYVAADLGAESGRVLVGRFDGGRVDLQEVHRFPNVAVRTIGRLQGCAAHLRRDHGGLGRAGRGRGSGGRRRRLWGVDFGLLDAAGGCSATPTATATSAGEP